MLTEIQRGKDTMKLKEIMARIISGDQSMYLVFN